MTFIRRFVNGFRQGFSSLRAATVAPPSSTEANTAPHKEIRRIDWGKVRIALQSALDQIKPKRELKPWEPMPGVVPKDKLQGVLKLAMDSMPYGFINGMPGPGLDNFFKGYPYLAQLSQMPEYRSIASTIAEEMTRKFIMVKGKDASVDKERITEMEELLTRYKVQEVLTKALEQDGFFGRSQIYADVKTGENKRAFDDPAELETLMALSPKKIAKGSLVGFTVVEAMWSYPGIYNSTNPLDSNYYKPESWYVMGKTVHDSRLHTIIGQPVPDLLKAAYSFGGLSLSQIAEPYVDNWIRTRNSVGDIVHSFSMTFLKTNLSAILGGAFGDEDVSNVMNRLAVLTQWRDNRNAIVVDKDSEDLAQINTPLTTLDKLQAQAQEHICSITHIPLVKYTGLSPTGLNASSDGEIRVWYDYILARQKRVMKPALDYMFSIIQLAEWGEIDESLTYEFVPLYEPTKKEQAELDGKTAEQDAAYIEANVLSQQDVRQIITNDPNSRYASLNPALPEELEQDAELDDADLEAGIGHEPGNKSKVKAA